MEWLCSICQTQNRTATFSKNGMEPLYSSWLSNQTHPCLFDCLGHDWLTSPSRSCCMHWPHTSSWLVACASRDGPARVVVPIGTFSLVQLHVWGTGCRSFASQPGRHEPERMGRPTNHAVRNCGWECFQPDHVCNLYKLWSTVTISS
jgi:hypothetical protein